MAPSDEETVIEMLGLHTPAVRNFYNGKPLCKCGTLIAVANGTRPGIAHRYHLACVIADALKVSKRSEQTVCCKCGSVDIFTDFHRASTDSRFPACRRDRSTIDWFPTDPNEHLHRTCRGCHYEWIDPTLDQQGKRSAQDA